MIGQNYFGSTRVALHNLWKMLHDYHKLEINPSKPIPPTNYKKEKQLPGRLKHTGDKRFPNRLNHPFSGNKNVNVDPMPG